MAYTKFGEFMRIQRVKHHEIMGDTAELFNVKLPFISAVENGKKNVPEDWFDIIVEHYDLDKEEQAKLRNAIDESKTQIKFDLSASTNMQRRVAFQFQRSFDKLDEQTANEILKILNKEDS